MAERAGSLDRLIARLLAGTGYRFDVACDGEPASFDAYRLRAEAVLDRGWTTTERLPGGLERDDFDTRSVHVVGWSGDQAVSSGRIVLPPGPLPTEVACDIVVEPVGAVVDVGRLVVARDHQDPHHQALVALLCRMYLEVRRRGFMVACGMMSPSVRGLARQLGLRLEVLGEPRWYWGEWRSPIRFETTANLATLADRWPRP